MSRLGDFPGKFIIRGVTDSGIEVPIAALEDPLAPGQYLLRVDTEITVSGVTINNLDVTRWNGNLVETNAGVAGAGTLRVIEASDSPLLAADETIVANVTNGIDATYNYYLDMRDYHYATIQMLLDCVAGTVTVTLDGTVEDAATGAAVTRWQDVTNDLFGVANLQAAAAPAEDIWVIDTACPFTWLRIQVVANTGANTGDWTIDQRRSW